MSRANSPDWILNPLTQRYIKRGSKTHKTLILSGQVTDLSPPRKLKRSQAIPEDYEESTDDDDDYASEEDISTDDSVNQENKAESMDPEESSEEEESSENEYSNKEEKAEIVSTDEDEEESAPEPELPNEKDIDEMDDEEIDNLWAYLRNLKKKKRK